MRWKFPAAVAAFSAALAFVLAVILPLAASRGEDPSQPASPALVPWPKRIDLAAGEPRIAADARIVAGDPALRGLAELLAAELRLIAGLQLAVADGAPRAGDIELALDPALAEEKPDQYTLQVTDRVTIRGSSYTAVAQGTATLLQALRTDDSGVSVPRLTIADGPALLYCGAMLDVARKPYSLDQLRQCVQVCRFYKIRYLHLHLTDENAWTFPSQAFPQLGSQNFAWAGGDAPAAYDLAGLRELVDYAQARGVVLVPEMEVPGHSGQLRGTLPELFGYHDAAGQGIPLGVINPASDEALAALDTLIGELCDVFHTSPYIHMGCDEATLAGAEQDPAALAFMQRHKLATGDELFNFMVHRLYDSVTRRGRKLIVWEGAPLGPQPLPKDVIHMPWVGHSDLASYLVREGYDVINAPWGVDEPYFDPWRVNQAQLAEGEPRLLGATSILWEAPAERALPYLRFTGALRNEPTYHPQARRGFDDFLTRLLPLDARLDRLLSGFSLAAEGALPPQSHGTLATMFERRLTLRLSAGGEDVRVHYTLDGSEPTPESPRFDAPLVLDETTPLKARRFDSAGQPLGATLVKELTRVPVVPHDAVAAAVTLDPPRPGYFGPGPRGITDGLLAAGNESSSPGWVGWASGGQPVTVTLDLGQAREVRQIAARCLRSGGGIFPPQSVAMQLSDDGATYRDMGAVALETGLAHRGWYALEVPATNARFVRIVAQPSAEWTFLDEVAVNPVLPAPDLAHAAEGKLASLAHSPVGYTAPGAAGLTDGYLSPTPSFLSLEWLGFEFTPLEATIDLGEPQEIRRVGGRFLEDVRAGIFVPGLRVLVSDDGVEFREAATIPRPAEVHPSCIVRHEAELTGVRARYVRFLSLGAGQWTFVDEVFVNPESPDIQGDVP